MVSLDMSKIKPVGEFGSKHGVRPLPCMVSKYLEHLIYRLIWPGGLVRCTRLRLPDS